MFEFTYNNTKYRALRWVESDENSNNFLILATDSNNEIRFIYSNNCNLPVDKFFLRAYSSDLSLNEITTYNRNDVKNIDIMEFKNCNLDKIDFSSLLSLYRRLHYNNSSDSLNLKDKIYKTMKNTLNNYRTNGIQDYNISIKELNYITKDLATICRIDNDKTIKLINEFLILVHINILTKMNLAELYSEEKKLNEILSGKTIPENEILYKKVDYNILSNRIYAALQIIIALKEDLVLIKLFGLTRKNIPLNPYSASLKDLENIKNRKFYFKKEARYTYNYIFYEKLGINTDIIEDEIYSYKIEEFDIIAENLFKLAKNAINESIDNPEFIKKYKYTKERYSNNKFIAYIIYYFLKV